MTICDDGEKISDDISVTILPGVGPQRGKILTDAGYNVDSLAKATKEEIASKTGGKISGKTADNIIAAAKNETARPLETKWNTTLKIADDQNFKELVARNMDELEQVNIKNLGLTASREKLIADEMFDRIKLRNADTYLNDIDTELSKYKTEYQAGKRTRESYIAKLKESIDQKNRAIKEAEQIQKNFDARFKDVPEIPCGEGGMVASGAIGTSGKAIAAGIVVGAAAGLVIAPTLLSKSGSTTGKLRIYMKTTDDKIQWYKDNLGYTDEEARQRVAKLEAYEATEVTAWANSTGLTENEFKRILEYDKQNGITISNDAFGKKQWETVAGYSYMATPGTILFAGKHGPEYYTTSEIKEMLNNNPTQITQPISKAEVAKQNKIRESIKETMRTTNKTDWDISHDLFMQGASTGITIEDIEKLRAEVNK